jgi:hypothetical protein
MGQREKWVLIVVLDGDSGRGGGVGVYVVWWAIRMDDSSHGFLWDSLVGNGDGRFAPVWRINGVELLELGSERTGKGPLDDS